MITSIAVKNIKTCNGCISIVNSIIDSDKYYEMYRFIRDSVTIDLDNSNRVKKIHLFVYDNITVLSVESILKYFINFLRINYKRKVTIILHYRFKFKDYKKSILNEFRGLSYDLIIDESKVSYFKRCKDSYYKISIGDVYGVTVDIIDTKQMIEERIK